MPGITRSTASPWHAFASGFIMSLDSCDAGASPGLAEVVCVVVVAGVAACAMFACGVRYRPVSAPLGHGDAAGEPVPTGSEGTGQAAADDAIAGDVAADVAPVDDDAAIVKDGEPSSIDGPVARPPFLCPSVLLDAGSLAALRRKLCHECPEKAGCFQRRLSDVFRDVRWGCFTRRGLIKICLRGLGCPQCEERGPTPHALLYFQKMIPHMVTIFWLDCYYESLDEVHNICSEHCEDALTDKRRRQTHPYIY